MQLNDSYITTGVGDCGQSVKWGGLNHGWRKMLEEGINDAVNEKINEILNKPVDIEVYYLNHDIDLIEDTKIGDWIDLRAAEDVTIKKGEFKLIPLGVVIKLPEGYEALLAPRSSTFKNFHIIQTNSVGVIDNSYCGPNDEWKMPVYATEDTVIHKNDRICQFRILKNQSIGNVYMFDTTENLKTETNRGGFGSTGVN